MKTQPTHTIDCDNRNEGFCICGAEPKRMLPTYTPTPWYATKPNSVGEILIKKDNPEPGLSMTILCKVYDDEKAALIVRAVNAQEELVSLVKKLRDLTLTESGARTQMTLMVDHVIAKAEGR